LPAGTEAEDDKSHQDSRGPIVPSSAAPSVNCAVHIVREGGYDGGGGRTRSVRTDKERREKMKERDKREEEERKEEKMWKNRGRNITKGQTVGSRRICK
jgi:hypothetical protein